jgi:MFS family permease
MTRLGATVGPAAGGAIGTYSYRWPFAVQAVVFLVAALMILAFLRTTGEPPMPPKPEVAPSSKASAEKSDEGATPPPIISREAYALLPIVVALNVARSARETLLPLRGDNLDLDAGAIGLITALSFTLDTALVPVAGYLMDAHGRKVACVPALSIQAFGFGALGVLPGTTGLVAASLLLGLGNGLSNGWIQTVGADLAPAGQKARFLGYWNAALNAGGAVGPILVGLLAQLTGSTLVASLAAGGAVAIGALWYALCGVETLVREEAEKPLLR